MELVANIWPVVDSSSGLIHRFAARAYVMNAPNVVISSTLRSLASTDYVLARQFPIPPLFEVVSEHGKLQGAASVDLFNQHQPEILEEALRTMEAEMPKLHGVGMDSEGKPFHQRITVSFPQDPYLVVTFLIEDADGNLHVQISP